MAVVLALAGYLLLPWALTTLAKLALSELGFPDATLHVTSVSLAGMTVNNVMLDRDGRVRCAAITAAYTPGGLLDGRLIMVDVRGLTIDGRLTDNGVQFAWLPKTSVDGGQTDDAPPFDLSALASWPVDMFGIEGILRIHDDEVTHHVPFQVHVNRSDDGEAAAGTSLHAMMEVYWRDLRLLASSEIDMTGEQAEMSGSLNLQDIFQPDDSLTVGYELLHADAAAEKAQVKLTIKGKAATMRAPEPITGLDATVRGASVQGEMWLTFGQAITLAETDLTVVLDQLEAFDQLASDLVLTVSQTGDGAIEYDFAGRAANYKLTSLTGALPSAPAKWASVLGDHVQQWQVQGTVPADVARPMSPWFDWLAARQGGAGPAMSITGRSRLHLDRQRITIEQADVVAEKHELAALRDFAWQWAKPAGDEASELAAASAGAATAGLLSVFPGQVKGVDVPAVEATVQQSAPGALGVDVVGRWPLGKDIDASITGWFGQPDNARQNHLRVAMDEAKLAKDDPLAAIAKAMSGTSVQGLVSLLIDVPIGESGPGSVDKRPALTARIRDASVSINEGSQELLGVDAAMVVPSLAQFAASGPHTVSWASGNVGKLAMTEGSLQWAIGPAGGVQVSEARTNLKRGGTVRLPATAIDKAGTVRTSLVLESVALVDWLDLLAPDQATGSGRLHGSIPLTIGRKPNGRLDVKIGRGFVAATDAGVIRVTDPKAIRQILPEFAEQSGNVKLVRDRTIGALEDFAFDRLRFEFIENDGKTLLRATTSGKGRQPPHQPLDLTVNFHDLDELIDLALRGYFAFGDARQRAGQSFFSQEP